MGRNNLVFLEILEWMDDTGQKIVHRIPEEGSGEIKYGAQLIVRESQAAVFFYRGKALDVFGPGQHTLKTANIPILTKIASIPWGMSSPLRAEVYFINLKVFTNLKWGTRDPVAFKDSELGLIRLRAFGVFNLRVVQPLLFINRMAGTQGIYTTGEVEEYLNLVIVSRFNDYMGEAIDSILTLPARYERLSEKLADRLQEDFSQFGLGLTNLYINAITPPPEVQQAIDDRSRMGVVQDMNKLLKMKAAMAMEKAAESQGNGGMGVGLGLMMPAIFADYLKGAEDRPRQDAPAETVLCPECRHAVPRGAKFCPLCGHQQIIFQKCTHCGKNIAPNANFCPRCGHPVEKQPAPEFCRACGAKNLSGAIYCNQCGEKL